MLQEIFAFGLLVIAIFFLAIKIFGKKKSKKDCGDGDCGCN